MTYGLPDSLLYGTYKRIQSTRHRSRPSKGSFSAPEFSYTFSGLILYPEVLDEAMNGSSGSVTRYMDRIADKLVNAARLKVGVRTGALRNSIRWSSTRLPAGQERTIGAYTSYAYDHHEGTPPHVIQADQEEVLRFSSKGRTVYSKQIFHPGTAPNPYLTYRLEEIIRSDRGVFTPR
jgi:hypothetical protein